MPEKKLRVGILGAGYVAQNNFFPVLPRFKDVEIVGVMARSQEHADDAKRRSGALHAVTDMEKLVELGIDCAFVLTPKATHAGQIEFLLQQGVDVYSEKPLATTLKDAYNVADLAAKSGRKLMIGFNRRFAPVCQKAKAACESKVPDVIIGQKNRPQTEYRATLENAIHIVDLMRYFGGEVAEVTAHAKYKDDPYYETFCTAHMIFENGAAGILVADRSAGQWEERIEMHGGNQSVLIEMPNSVAVTDANETHVTAMTPLAMGWAKSEDNMGFSFAIRHFLDCVQNDREPLTNAADALKTHELLDKVLRSTGLPAMDIA